MFVSIEILTALNSKEEEGETCRYETLTTTNRRSVKIDQHRFE